MPGVTTETPYGWLADAILIVHFAFVAFVVLGLAVIWIGYFLKREFIRNLWFRLAHLLAMAVVVLESVFDIVCPLTTWENELRVLAGSGTYQASFVQHWVHKWMFFRLTSETAIPGWTIKRSWCVATRLTRH